MKVVDFYCGAGGFSEGFRQAGFHVILAVDRWQTAVDTHSENHPETKTLKDDVIRISKLPDVEFHKLIPDSEVIIGSPPCTAFSNSNISGKADKSNGIELIKAYLRIVARKKFKKNSILKYWILENVPKVQTFLKRSYSAKDLELQGDFRIFVKGGNSGIYNAKFYGVPSNRERYFCGEFPEPNKVFEKEEELIPLNKILSSLGAPKEKLHENITDPLFDVCLRGEDVTDHHYIQELAEHEWVKAKRLKQDKGYMGKMSLPENPNRPARTIMATFSLSARESFILSSGMNRFRAPTIREIASLMSFPIDYRFYGASIRSKYRLVGNAVPPKMAFAFANSILKAEKKKTNFKYISIKHSNKIDFVNLNLDTFHINTEKPKKDIAKFKYHIPYFKFNNYRVELTNYHSNFSTFNIKWNVEIHHGQGPSAKIFTPQIEKINLKKKDVTIANTFLFKLKNKFTSFDEFQKIHCMPANEIKRNNFIGPYELLDLIRQFIDRKFKFLKGEKEIEVFSKDLKEIPRPIAIGYYLMQKCINNMASKTEKVKFINGNLSSSVKIVNPRIHAKNYIPNLN